VDKRFDEWDDSVPEDIDPARYTPSANIADVLGTDVSVASLNLAMEGAGDETLFRQQADGREGGADVLPHGGKNFEGFEEEGDYYYEDEEACRWKMLVDGFLVCGHGKGGKREFKTTSEIPYLKSSTRPGRRDGVEERKAQTYQQ
jgi:hypothetical protein